MPPLHNSKEDAIKNTPVGMWTYFGQNQPENNPDAKHQTFSVGIFRVTLNPKGEKDAQNSIMRLTHLTSQSEWVYRWAQYCVDQLNEIRNASGFRINQKVLVLTKRIAKEKLIT